MSLKDDKETKTTEQTSEQENPGAQDNQGNVTVLFRLRG